MTEIHRIAAIVQTAMVDPSRNVAGGEMNIGESATHIGINGYIDLGALVRVVLEELRDPTEAMHEAGQAIIMGGQGAPPDRPLPTLRNAYNAMIDAALRTSP